MVLKALNKIKTFLNMIRFEHTLFALPFAYAGALLVEKKIPSAHDVLWITAAMAGARTAAMALNRLIDRHIDALNPRTSGRALPRGMLSVVEVWVYVMLSFVVLFYAAMQLSPLAVKLFPVAVLVLWGYSYSKRFTWLCHVWLGAALGLAPLGSWIAISNQFNWEPLVLSAGVLFWVAGFDIIYACMDYEFDIVRGIHSIPARFGVKNALHTAAAFHLLAAALFFAAGVVLNLGIIYFAGVALALIILLYEHILVSPRNLDRVNVAFFNMNAILSVSLFVFTLLDIVV
ncbi:MAG: putative 4-hydroxybenzoate polyprenyltransferase [Clostridiales bacterium]|nr:putative 4-hydroxybenzoate polyprenyltransferase [Clostridiales bacterium]MCF8023486.1 putative 4-hydroxybenzoate polyprenyltransferase [Clostridiales bacterium]